MEFSEIIFILLAIVFTIFQWLGDRGKKAKAAEEQRRRAERAREQGGMRQEMSGSGNPRGETAEEARARKFMEALGLPADTPIRRPSAPVPPVPPTPPAVARREAPAPVIPEPPRFEPVRVEPIQPERAQMEPKPSAPPVPPSFEQPAPTPPRPTIRQVSRPAQLPRPQHLPAPSFASRVPGLSSTVGAEASQDDSAGLTPLGPVQGRHFQKRKPAAEGQSDRLIDLSSPQAIRRALVMSEVLGKPKGLA